uniref:Ammonium_transp domain-containing protein n=1 Tax=Macrostomum lignano TaxID=282301 RepID=A0A1I8I9W1_9PLAT
KLLLRLLRLLLLPAPWRRPFSLLGREGVLTRRCCPSAARIRSGAEAVPVSSPRCRTGACRGCCGTELLAEAKSSLVTERPAKGPDGIWVEIGGRLVHQLMLSNRLPPRRRLAATAASLGEELSSRLFAAQADQLIDWPHGSNSLGRAVRRGAKVALVGRASRRLLLSILLLAVAGFAFLEAGSVRSKGVTNILIKNALDAFFGGIAYYAMGWALAYGEPSNWFCGTANFFLFNMPDGRLAQWFFEYVFAATAATIVSGAMAERCNFLAYIVYSTFITDLDLERIWKRIWRISIGSGADLSGSGADLGADLMDRIWSGSGADLERIWSGSHGSDLEQIWSGSHGSDLGADLDRIWSGSSWIGSGADLERISWDRIWSAIWSGSGADLMDRGSRADLGADLERISIGIWSGSRSDLERISWIGSQCAQESVEWSALPQRWLWDDVVEGGLTPNAASAPGQKASSTDVLEWGQLVVSLDKQLQQRRKRQAQTGLKNPGKQPTPTSNESAGQEVGTKAERKMDKLGEVQADMLRLNGSWLPFSGCRSSSSSGRGHFWRSFVERHSFDVRGSRSRSGSSRHRQSSSFVGISVGQRVDQPGQIFWPSESDNPWRRSQRRAAAASASEQRADQVGRSRQGVSTLEAAAAAAVSAAITVKANSNAPECRQQRLYIRLSDDVLNSRWAYAARQGSKGRPGRLRLPASERLRRGMTERRREHVPSVVAEATAGASSSCVASAASGGGLSSASRRNASGSLGSESINASRSSNQKTARSDSSLSGSVDACSARVSMSLNGEAALQQQRTWPAGRGANSAVGGGHSCSKQSLSLLLSTLPLVSLGGSFSHAGCCSSGCRTSRIAVGCGRQTSKEQRVAGDALHRLQQVRLQRQSQVQHQQGLVLQLLLVLTSLQSRRFRCDPNLPEPFECAAIFKQLLVQ